jgi:hypothetical protein
LLLPKGPLAIVPGKDKTHAAVAVANIPKKRKSVIADFDRSSEAAVP